MTPPSPSEFAEFLSSVGGIEAFPHLLRLLARGEPVALEELAASEGEAGADLARVVRAQPGAEWDSDGRLVGFGLTPRPTDYRLLVAGKTLYTFCAIDTLLFTVILGEETVVESTCPTTGVPIRLELTPERVTTITPPDSVVSQRLRQDLVEDLRGNMCDHTKFFASKDAAADWLAAHPDGQVLSVADGFAQCKAACDELGWLSSDVATP